MAGNWLNKYSVDLDLEYLVDQDLMMNRSTTDPVDTDNDMANYVPYCTCNIIIYNTLKCTYNNDVTQVYQS